MEMQKIAVIGHPIGHTMSPFIHKRLFQLSGIPVDYHVLDIGNPADAAEELRSFDAFNVTLPHKETIIPYLDEMDEKAKLFGSVNTVQVTGGKMKGYTTDGTGFAKALENGGIQAEGAVLVLGNGGAARAIAFEIAYRSEAFRITIACRDAARKKAEAIAEEITVFGRERGKSRSILSVKTYAELARSDEKYALVVNATNVGMYPHTEESPVGGEILTRCKAAFDAVYNPAETRFLQNARDLGLPAVGGMDMLVFQAVAAHEIWYGSAFKKGDIGRLCADAVPAMKQLFESK